MSQRVQHAYVINHSCILNKALASNNRQNNIYIFRM